MVRYEYRMERVPLRTRELDALNELGSKGFEAIQAIEQNNTLIVLLMKEIETKSPPAKKKEEPKKQASKKDQQDIKDVAPATKQEKEVIEELKAEE